MKFLLLFSQLSTKRKLLLLLTCGISLYTFIILRKSHNSMSFGKNKIANNESTDLLPLLNDIAFAIRTVSKNVPWENKCRHQAYQAKLLLKHFNISCQIYVGFNANQEGILEGHAWTMVNDKMITGFCNPTDYKVLAVYS